MLIGIPTESYPNEARVALIPAFVAPLKEMGFEVLVEKGAEKKAGFLDTDYEKQGARLISDRAELFATADILFQVRGLGANPNMGQSDLNLFHEGQILIGLFNPLGAPESVQAIAEKGVSAFALELLPRIGKAQSMDVLTSMATLVGYKAVILAADSLQKIFPMMITASGTIAPARVFVMGAGVAGLEAIATAHRLGARVKGYDIRPAVKEQVESLGAQFLEIELESSTAEASTGYAKEMDEEFYRRQRELMMQTVAESDAVITTAAIPGKKAPVLITKEMVQAMSPGSVIIDLAAESGGNCELTQPGDVVEIDGVKIIGLTNLSSTISHHASQMYSKNVTSFLQHLMQEGKPNFNREDPIIGDTLLTKGGQVVNPKVLELLNVPIESRGC